MLLPKLKQSATVGHVTKIKMLHDGSHPMLSFPACLKRIKHKTTLKVACSSHAIV